MAKAIRINLLTAQAYGPFKKESKPGPYQSWLFAHPSDDGRHHSRQGIRLSDALCGLSFAALAARWFHQLFFEGTGDIDIRFLENGKSSRTHIQVKDHQVSASEFKTVVTDFRRFDTDLPNVYKKFTLACPSLATALRPVEAGLARLRGATSFYDDAPGALSPTKHDIDSRLRARGLGDELIAFIHSKVFIDVGHGELAHDDRAVDLFVARMLSHPDHASKVRAMVQPAFSELMRAILANKGSVLDRAAIETILQSAIITDPAAEKTVTVWVHNWTKEPFDAAADYVLDWSSHFDRATRRVPSQGIWNANLLPELVSLHRRILVERAERVIRFRGKCTLSTGVAMGATFPAVGGWVFEVPQPPDKEHWRSDAPAPNSYDLQIETTAGAENGTDLVLGLNIRGDGRADVIRYVESTGIAPKMFAFMSPPTKGAQSIGGAGEARAFSLAMRDRLGEFLKNYHLSKTRIFFYGPFALAVFVGQQLTSVGEVQLFEYQDPGYTPSFFLRT
jgi:hypothetical protein